MKIRYIISPLLLMIFLQNNIFAMEKSNASDAEIEKKESIDLYIFARENPELLAKIIYHIIEHHINHWNEITDFRLIQDNITQDVVNVFSVSKGSAVLSKKERADYLNSLIEQRLKDKVNQALKNREEKTAQLIGILNQNNISVADWQKVNTLINDGADIDIGDASAYTALMWAAFYDIKDVVNFLINSGANINAVNRYGKTSLMLAAQQGNIDMVELLIDRNANINAKTTLGIDCVGYTALMYAINLDRKDIAKLLITLNADLGTRDINGNTALMLAVEYRDNADIVELLIDKGPNINTQNYDGDTALILAVENNNVNIVKLLIAKGADINIKGKHGLTALDIAIDNEDKDIINLFTS